MEEPSPRSSRLALAGALAATLVVGGGGFLLGRATSEQPPVEESPAVATPEPTPTAAPTLSAVLGRAELIALAADAADAAAAGGDAGAQVAQADGRRFELRLPFGCEGPARDESNAMMRWQYDAEDQALRFHVRPVTWTAQDWWGDDAAPRIETIEGFWIERPWTSSEECPVGGRPAAAGFEPVTLPGQTLAVGQVFSSDASRGGRRNGDAFEATVRVPEAQLNASEGFRLRITGRLASTHGRPVHCPQPAGAAQRPVCLVSVVLDEVAIVNPVNGRTLATWTLGGQATPGA